MSDGGYVRLYRALIGHAAFRNDGESMAFAWMIARAAWKPVRVRYKGQSITLERGQLAVSVRDLATTLDRPKGWVERLFARLKSETMIETISETGVTIITICNYDEYQAEQDSDRTADETPRGTPAGQRQDTEQRREEIKKGIEDRFTQSNPRARTSSDDAPPSPFELQARQIAEVIRLTRPISPNDREQLRHWLRDGLHFEFHVVEAAKQVAARELGRGRSISGFRYLDGAVREYAAAWHADRERYQEIAAGGSR